MKDLEKLALMQAMYKWLGERLSTKNPCSFRSKMDEDLFNAYTENGVDRKSIDINGEHIGTYSLSFTKAVDGVEPYIADAKKVAKWLQTKDGYSALESIVLNNSSAVLKAVMADGELIDGIKTQEVHEPRRVKGSTLRVDVSKLQAAYKANLPSAVNEVLALGDGNAN